MSKLSLMNEKQKYHEDDNPNVMMSKIVSLNKYLLVIEISFLCTLCMRDGWYKNVVCILDLHQALII